MGDENDADYVYDAMQVYLCPSWALSLGYMGVAAGACLSNWGSAVSFIYFNLARERWGVVISLRGHKLPYHNCWKNELYLGS